MNEITDVTFNDIVDIIKNGFTIEREVYLEHHPDWGDLYDTEYEEIKITFFGKLDEIMFLKRLYDLKKLPATYSRFNNAEEEIWNHTVNNDDYEPFWFFDFPTFEMRKNEKKILNFICEMFHPAVRNEREPWKDFLNKFNELLKYDDYEIYPKDKISGRDVYGWRITKDGNLITETQSKNIIDSFDSSFIKSQIEIMHDSIHKNPTEAIGKAKELSESCCKTILEDTNSSIDKKWDLQKLIKETCKQLKLTPNDIPDKAKASESIKQILRSLASITQGMAELRNPYGSGHGKSASYKGLTSRHANLAVGSSITLVHFLWDTYQEQKQK